MFALLALVIWQAELHLLSSFPLPDNVGNVEAFMSSGQAHFILDSSSALLIKVNADGRVLASRRGRGQGPGDFQRPRSLYVLNDIVLVGDMFKLHKFDTKDLEFKGAVPIFNNVKDISVFDNRFFLSTSQVPNTGKNLHVLDLDGTVEHSFYENPVDRNSYSPFFEQDDQGRLYVLHARSYHVDILDRIGNTTMKLNLKRPPQYREVVSFEPFQKKYGPTMAAFKHWSTAWSAPSNIVLSKNYLLLCFEELQQDLLTKKYFLEAYDLKTKNKVIQWREIPGRLLQGGDQVWFVEDSGHEFRIAAYEMSR